MKPNAEEKFVALSAAKYIAEMESLLESGVKQITLTRSQLVNLVSLASKASQKARDAETGRLRRAMWRAETSSIALARALKEHRTMNGTSQCAE